MKELISDDLIQTHDLSGQNQSPEFFWKGFEDLLLLEDDMLCKKNLKKYYKDKNLFKQEKKAFEY